jgi:hypothetical protein
MSTCPAYIDIQGPARLEQRGRGFSRRAVCVYFCPVCGAQRDLRKNWLGPTPPGAFVCGAVVQKGKP